MSKSAFLADNEVNTGRQEELDIMKAIIIFFLAGIHCFVECTTNEDLNYGIPYFFDSVLGGPLAAPMFIFMMGIGLSYSKRNDADHLFKRSIHIFITAIALNVARFLIPSLIGYAVSKDYKMYIEHLPYKFFGNDLLNFAFLAMLLMSLMRYLKLKPWTIWFIALGLNLFAMVFNSLDFNNVYLNVILGHFIGVQVEEEIVVSDFPLLIWFFMYASGYVYGGYLKRMKDRGKFYKYVSPVSLILVLVIYPVEYYGHFGMMGGKGANVFYHMKTPEMILCILNVFALAGVYYLIKDRIPDKLKDVILRTSKNITIVYFIQWVLVWWTINLFIYLIRGSKYLTPIPGLILGIILGFASVILADLWSESRKKKRERSNEKKS